MQIFSILLFPKGRPFPGVCKEGGTGTSNPNGNKGHCPTAPPEGEETGAEWSKNS